MGNRMKGKEVRKGTSIRLEPRVKRFLIKKYGKLQVAIDTLIEKAMGSNK